MSTFVFQQAATVSLSQKPEGAPSSMNAIPSRPEIVILTPVYNEEQNLPFYAERVRKVLLDRSDVSFRVLLIDDGSVDGSWEKIEAICRGDDRYRGIRLSRNFGSHAAVTAGFYHTDGDAYATLACDLQDPPEVILEYVDRWRAGARIVWGKRRTRADEFWRVHTSNFFHRLLKHHAMPKGSRFTTGSFFLVDRKVAECFRQFQEANRITFALVAWTGFNQAVVEYDRVRRERGVSGWNLSRMLKTMYAAVIGFSLLPVRLITALGVTAFGLAILTSIYLVASWFQHKPVAGWTSVMLLLSMFFGLQFLILGVIGEYLYRIYSETVRRPIYFVSDRTDES
jgi:glycosyltransferase involved in cell wall biosynthesis